MTRLVQLEKNGHRTVALVEEPNLRLLANSPSVHQLANAAIAGGVTLSQAVRQNLTRDLLKYNPIYSGESDWRLLSPIDHPNEPARCLISGTGLTHLGSARERQAMHTNTGEELTDSMKMFRSGITGGHPPEDQIGSAPEWFYKGPGTILRAHLEPLEVPPYAEDGGEEAEVAGIYLIAPDGRPRRLGMAAGNEFSDHRFEKKNYLNLAGSKLRTCALGPELSIDPVFESVPGTVIIERGKHRLWSKPIRTGEAEMCHSLGNIEHHHFKFEAHRRPGDIHVHFLGADSLSFGDGIELADGDVIEISFETFGRPLRNPVRVSEPGSVPLHAASLG
jgi:hypothetical protein